MPSCLSPLFPQHLLPQTPQAVLGPSPGPPGAPGPAAPHSAAADPRLGCGKSHVSRPKSDVVHVTVQPRQSRSCCKPQPPPSPIASIGHARSHPLWKRLPGAEGVSRRLGPTPTCGRSLSTNSCFWSSRSGRNPPASTANTAIRSRPCQLSRWALQPARPLGSPSPSPARGPLRAGRHQSQVLAQGDPAEPDPGSRCPRDVPSVALIPPSL